MIKGWIRVLGITRNSKERIAGALERFLRIPTGIDTVLAVPKNSHKKFASIRRHTRSFVPLSNFGVASQGMPRGPETILFRKL